MATPLVPTNGTNFSIMRTNCLWTLGKNWRHCLNYYQIFLKIRR